MMRYSKLVGKTLMSKPGDADSRNSELLVQAGFVRKLAAGVYNFLPLGKLTLQKIEQIIREEMNAIDGQEIAMPALVPLENWQQTNRDKADIAFKTMGANDREFILGWSHEEVVTPLVKEFIESYRDLPLAVYQLQTKFRNEKRAKSGVLRGREFSMKDMYSFHENQADLEDYYERVKQAYLNVFTRCGLKAYTVTASGGSFSDKLSHEFAVATEAGEDTIVVYPDRDYAENIEVAKAYVGAKNADEAEVELGEIKVERELSVAANAQAHNVPLWKILKTVVYKVGEGFVGVVIRGDLQVDQERIEKYFDGSNVRIANDDELQSLGLVKGFISPIKNDKIEFIGDESVKSVVNFVTGANVIGLDYVGVNLGRDFALSDFAHLAQLTPEVFAGETKETVELLKAVEVGNIFQLGSLYSDAFELKYTDSGGENNKIVMGCYGIGISRLLGTIAEVSNDENGLIWPKSVSPFAVHLVDLGKEESVKSMAEDLYTKLTKTGYSTLYDDRDERAGKKFNDADLIGIPVRVLVSARGLENDQFELKLRTESEPMLLNEDGLFAFLKEYYAD